MGLKQSTPEGTTSTTRTRKSFPHRDYDGLSAQLLSEDSSERRWAARDLSEYSQAVPSLLKTLGMEEDTTVLTALLDSLQQIGGEEVVEGLIQELRSEDAFLRNGVIEILHGMPDEVAPHITELLTDVDSDVRIFTIDILRDLSHPRTPEWLRTVLSDERHINVISTAVDVLTEVGTVEMLEALAEVRERFSEEAYLGFAVDMAVERISGGK